MVIRNSVGARSAPRLSGSDSKPDGTNKLYDMAERDERIPGLCDHGLRVAACGSCDGCDARRPEDLR